MYLILYVNRVNISTVAPLIKADLRLNNTQLGLAFSAFGIPYAVLQLFGGWFGDRLGPRKVIVRIALCWVAFTALTGAAWNFSSLVLFRFLFGMGEAGAFPNIARAGKEWFPFSERGFAQGLVWLCARWGGGPCRQLAASQSIARSLKRLHHNSVAFRHCDLAPEWVHV